MERELMLIEEVAVRVKRPLDTVRRWRRDRIGPPMFRMGNRVYAYRDEVEDWIRENREKAS